MFANVITFPLSEILSPVPAVIVTPVLPDVFELIIDVVPVPAPTVKLPSFAIFPSTSLNEVKYLPSKLIVWPLPPVMPTVRFPEAGTKTRPLIFCASVLSR